MAVEPAQTTEPTETPETDAPERTPLSLLASELYGPDYVGEVDTPEKPEETPDEPEQEPEQKVVEPEGDDTPDPDEGEKPESETDEIPISSVPELIEHLECDGEWFDGLAVPVKVDGKDDAVPLSELKASFQMSQAAEKRLADAKVKAKATNQELAEKSEALEGQFAVAAKLIEQAGAVLDEDVKAVNWAKLRDEDPAEYSAKKADIAERRERIDGMKRDAVTEYSKIREQRAKEAKEKRGAKVAEETEKVLEAIPEWNDPEKAKAETAKLTEFLLSRGFSEQDVAVASDHRLILLARDAMLFNDVAQSEPAKKKLRKVPKVLKPGAPKSAEQKSKEREDKARAKLRQSGSLDDAYTLLKLKRGG